MDFKIHGQIPKPVKKIAICTAIIILVCAVVYFTLDRTGFIKTFKLAIELQQQQEQQSQDRVVLENLGKIMLLPKNTAPTMAVINDVDALKKQQATFFSDAKNGDRLIVFPNMAVIYDYPANKIIHVGPVQITQTEQPTQQQAK
jgi:hypothetical protein